MKLSFISESDHGPAYHNVDSVHDLLGKSPARLFDLIDKITLPRDPSRMERNRGVYRDGVEIDNDFLSPSEAKALKLFLGGPTRNQAYRSNPYNNDDVGELSGSNLSEISRALGVNDPMVRTLLASAKRKLEINLQSGSSFDDVIGESGESDDTESVIKAAKMVVQIWNDYTKLNNYAEPVEDIDDYLADVEDGEPLMIPFIDAGSKWEGLSKRGVKVGGDLASVVGDIVDFVNEYFDLEEYLYYGWELDRGRATFKVGMNVETGDLEDAYDSGVDSRWDQEADSSEKDFMSGSITESVESLDYRTLINQLVNADKETIQKVAASSDRPFVQAVVDALLPKFDEVSGRYGVKYSDDFAPWYSDAKHGLHLEAQKYDGEPFMIELHDADDEFGRDVYDKLIKPEHKLGSKAIGWAAGFEFEGYETLVVIEIQSDLIRGALAEQSDINRRILSSFSNWQDELIQMIRRYADQKGLGVIRFPTARKLGRFWRSVGEKPNMKYLKALYDKKFRDVAVKKNDWWVLK